ncbi:MAG: hypothetical protein ACI93L_001082 [Cyclobacteriaceae bacterium]|jgi:hypothetical protein
MIKKKTDQGRQGGVNCLIPILVKPNLKINITWFYLEFKERLPLISESTNIYYFHVLENNEIGLTDK